MTADTMLGRPDSVAPDISSGDEPFLYRMREIHQVSMGGTTSSSLAAITKRASESGPDD